MKRSPMHSLRERAGFALPMALLVMVVLTAGITAGFAATSSETITNAAHRGDTRAYNLAVAGLEQFLARRSETGFCSNCLADPTAAAADSEWTRVSLTGGYADIKSVRVRKHINDTLPALYFIRSTGTDTSIRLTGATSAIAGQRAVGIYATWNTATVQVQGAWVALSGLVKNGNAGRIDGTDECTAEMGGGKATLPGAVVPSGGFSGSTTAFIGSPPLDTTKSFSTLSAGTKLDWAGIIGGSITPDYHVYATTDFPPADFFTSNPTAWPIIRVYKNNFSLPVAGRGMIIADSNFSINGSNMWDGIVLIGGKLTSNGNNTTSGATLSGLNLLLGANPGSSEDTQDNSIANGQKTYVYNSCNVEKASKGLQSYKAMTNTYIDQLPVW
ncbi:MAG TPA: hypothetical protein VFO55_06890 [Gemmatimonadaceae bacterium]|nr:hypothetical protein [Gemmatimonadaceae bacterium]